MQTYYYGVRAGDRIIKVNGKLCIGLGAYDVGALIQRYAVRAVFSLGIWTTIWSSPLSGIFPLQKALPLKKNHKMIFKMIVCFSKGRFSCVLACQILKASTIILLCTWDKDL